MWPIAVTASSIAAMIATLLYGVIRFINMGIKIGEDRASLRHERAARKAMEEGLEASNKAEEAIEEATEEVDNLTIDDRIDILAGEDPEDNNST